MVYQPNIPQATDRPSDSQQDLLNNFSQLNTQLSVNHTALTASSKNGYHTKISFAGVLGSDPNLTSPDSSLYTKTVSALTQLFFQNGSTSSDVFQLTGLTVTSSANGGNAGGTIYQIDTPWGLRAYFGVTAAMPSLTGRAVDFPNGGFSTIYFAIACSQDPVAVAVSLLKTTSGLTLIADDSIQGIDYIAVGVKA